MAPALEMGSHPSTLTTKHMTDEKKGEAGVPASADNTNAIVDMIAESNVEAKDKEGVSGDDTGSKPSEATPSTEDKAGADNPDQSYEALRIKMNDQGVELNALRRQLQEEGSKSKRADELSSQIQTVTEELAAHKKWYDQFYPVLNELYKDDAIRARIESGIKPPTVTPEDAEKIFERKMKEFKDQTSAERTVDQWVASHPDVKGELAKNIYGYLEKHDLDPSPEILEMAYVFLTKDKLKEIGAKEREAHEKKVADAMVGGGANAAAGKTRNPIDDLFMEPVANFYPGAKNFQ